MNMMAYHRSDDITIDLMAATIDMMTGLPISMNIQVAATTRGRTLKG